MNGDTDSVAKFTPDKMLSMVPKDVELDYLRRFVDSLEHGTVLHGIFNGIVAYAEMQMESNTAISITHMLAGTRRQLADAQAAHKEAQVAYKAALGDLNKKDEELNTARFMHDEVLAAHKTTSTRLHGVNVELEGERIRHKLTEKKLDDRLTEIHCLKNDLAQVQGQAEMQVLHLKAALWDMSQAKK